MRRPEDRDGLLLALVGGMIGISVVTAVLGVGQTWLTNVVGQRVMHDLRTQVYRHLQRLSLAFFTKTRTGEIQSRIANGVRGAILRDGTRDSGCGLKAFPRDVGLALPYFDGLHRFLPALVRREGRDIGYVDVVDRPRGHGQSNYGMWDRLWVGILDLCGVWWLIRRKKRVPEVSEV